MKNSNDVSPLTCPNCGSDVIIQEVNTYKLQMLPDGKLQSKIYESDLSVSCANNYCKADLSEWVQKHIDSHNIIGDKWYDD